jgi:3-dehydroquinate synthetase
LGALETVSEALLEARIERIDAALALGGGVVGDLAGFAAGTVLRGIRFVQVPTTLLAQVDSSIGGKTGINTGHGKNLVGVFHQPSFVLADSGVLDSLPEREFNAGYAEVAKCGLIGAPDFFKWLETNWRAAAAGQREREQAIAIAAGPRRRRRRGRARRAPLSTRSHLRPRARGRHRLFAGSMKVSRLAWCSPRPVGALALQAR